MYKKTVSDNGLRIITHHMPGMGSVAVGIWIRVGGRDETSEHKGISHFLEHLAFKGTKHYSCRKIKESVEGVGGSLNGFTSEEVTCYLIKLPARYIDLALDILADMAINPLMPEEEIEKERAVIIEEIKMYKDLPQSYVHDLLDELLWPDQPLGMTISGTVDSVSRIQQKGLVLFKEQNYTPANIVISAAGLLGNNGFVKKAEDIFSCLSSSKSNVFAPAKEAQDAPQLKIFPKDTEQTHLALGFRSLKRDHPLKHALSLLHIILGANMSSRLFNEIREKRGLAYEIGTHVKRFQDTGAFVVHAGIDNNKVSETVRLILEELKKTRDKLVTADEFKRAKEFYLGQLMLALEDTLDHMLWVGESTITLGKAYSQQDIVKEVNKVKREDLLKAAVDIFREDKLNLAFIGPLRDNEKQLHNQLRFG